ncbi:hypothetical protein TNIN_220241 [Trichonephila inaurata madagascariensis]|uniref:Uncharacterized protein n=1 Tax=Trichonephila inaurata madagascariensis TaxID=2747483 RepID=A0A8X7CK47_9ARAC|nr:hypothetical protein TNIN_220241 [Trichonephila inaurata madagascariensis]
MIDARFVYVCNGGSYQFSNRVTNECIRCHDTRWRRCRFQLHRIVVRIDPPSHLRFLLPLTTFPHPEVGRKWDLLTVSVLLLVVPLEAI